MKRCENTKGERLSLCNMQYHGVAKYCWENDHEHLHTDIKDLTSSNWTLQLHFEKHLKFLHYVSFGVAAKTPKTTNSSNHPKHQILFHAKHQFFPWSTPTNSGKSQPIILYSLYTPFIAVHTPMYTPIIHV